MSGWNLPGSPFDLLFLSMPEYGNGQTSEAIVNVLTGYFTLDIILNEAGSETAPNWPKLVDPWTMVKKVKERHYEKGRNYRLSQGE